MATGFSIDGEWLTEHSRNLVREGRWDHAMRTLVDGLDGMTNDIALMILKGDKKLTGVDDIGLADDDDVKYRGDLAYHFSGVYVDTHGRYLRPYAVITSWCKDDLWDDDDFLTPGSQRAEVTTNGHIRHYRNPLHYADNPRADIAVKVDIPLGQISNATNLPLGENSFVLCHLVNNYPHLLYRAHRDAKSAIKEMFDRGVRLAERGGAQWLGSLDTVEESSDIKAAVAKIIEGREGESFDERVARQNRELSQRLDHKASLDVWKAAITEQAAGNYFPLSYTRNGEAVTVMVPTAPFENWAMWRTIGADLALPWTKVCPSGLKMHGDDAYHTDWMVGAGIELDAFNAPGSDLNDRAFDRYFALQEEKLKFDAAVLCGSKHAYGAVVHPKAGESVARDAIAVIPNAGPRYLQAALTAAGVVVEQGGAMAHLVTIGREQGVTIMRVENARTLYPVGSRVSLDPETGSVSLSPTTVRDAFGEIGID